MNNYIIQSVSCIVPAYNSAMTIHACINGLLGQTFQNIEIIIVDDGSKDGTGKLCDEYAEKYKNVKVIHQDNAGVSRARNTALKYATGDRIIFVDADDEIQATYVENLIAEEADWVLGGYMNGAHIIAIQSQHYIDSEIPQFFSTHFHRLYSTVPWGKLYKRSIIQNNNLKFDPNIRLGEDLIFNLNYLLHCDSVVTISSTGYNYIQEEFGADRYNLKIEEIEYTLNQVSKGMELLSQKYENTKFTSEAIKRTLIGAYPLDYILNGRYDEYEALYFSTFFEKDRKVFWNDAICSPFMRGTRKIKYLIKKHQYAIALHLMLQLLYAYCKYSMR